ncbi:unnamed protein product [Adineta ricciae]|uniref:Alpha 1,4-glycosyltransferase domain-containing protein n=1 Tax=Adineta ricciae TaxID=249248 RepID=A0A813U5S2_ADIRI|nr:unnamed protein product [Adineta ricciae]CAF0818135.1 unnamed protein product [Adineta ricciae]
MNTNSFAPNQQITMFVLKLKTINSLRWPLIFMIVFLIVYISITQLSRASLYGVVNIFTVDFNDATNNQIQVDENHLLLEDLSQREFELINSRSKIFFVQTSENDDLLSRHACSIESAARLHLTSLVFVLMRSKTIHLKKGSFNRLQSYTNIRFVHFNEHDIYSGTTLARLNQTKRTQFIRYFAISHMSDFIRTALLYKYGGIYFDLDVIPLKNFRSLANAVALESSDGVNVAVLTFEKQHLLLDIQMDIQIMFVNQQFNSLCWNCVGPLALSDALKRVCDDNILHVHSKDKCHDIDIQPSFVFYPITYHQIPQFFRRTESSNGINDLIRNSSVYSVHYFHHMTMNLPIEYLSPFARIAQVYCPHVYEHLIDYHEFQFKQSNSVFHRFRLYLLFCLCVILLLAGAFSSHFTSIRVVMLSLRHKISYA